MQLLSKRAGLSWAKTPSDWWRAVDNGFVLLVSEDNSYAGGKKEDKYIWQVRLDGETVASGRATSQEKAKEAAEKSVVG